MRGFVRKQFPAGATLDDVLERVEQILGTPVRLVDDLDLGGYSGVWVHSANMELICLPPTHPDRRTAIIAHEIGHMLLGHGSRRPGVQAMRCGYRSPKERAAELFGTYLVTRMGQRRLTTSSSIALR